MLACVPFWLKHKGCFVFGNETQFSASLPPKQKKKKKKKKNQKNFTSAQTDPPLTTEAKERGWGWALTKKKKKQTIKQD